MRGHLVVLAALGTTAAFSPPAVSGSAAGELGLRRPAQGCGISMVKDAKNGPFGPVVKGAKQVLGESTVTLIRTKAIQKHSEVIAAFCESAESPVGKIALKQLFRLADKDGNGAIDKKELKEALHALGFTHLNEKQIDMLFKRASVDGSTELGWEEFMESAPKALRVNLILLAKNNGNELGFLV